MRIKRNLLQQQFYFFYEGKTVLTLKSSSSSLASWLARLAASSSLISCLSLILARSSWPLLPINRIWGSSQEDVTKAWGALGRMSLVLREHLVRCH